MGRTVGSRASSIRSTTSSFLGTPIAGYQAPLERILPCAARSLSALVSVIEALRKAGKRLYRL